MDAQELSEKVRQRPFDPFRIHLSGGTAYDVAHPEQIIVGRRSSHVGLGANAQAPFQRIAIVANIHITRLEPVNRQRTQAE